MAGPLFVYRNFGPLPPFVDSIPPTNQILPGLYYYCM
jgi:hypothetical protein